MTSSTLFEFNVSTEKPITHANSTLPRIGGYHEIMQELYEFIVLPLKHPELFQYMNVEPIWTLLIKGPSGTG